MTMILAAVFSLGFFVGVFFTQRRTRSIVDAATRGLDAVVGLSESLRLDYHRRQARALTFVNHHAQHLPRSRGDRKRFVRAVRSAFTHEPLPMGAARLWRDVPAEPPPSGIRALVQAITEMPE